RRDAERGVWIANVFCAVIAHHGLEPRYSRHDSLWPTAESGKEMRFNEAGDDSHVGFDDMSVEQGRRAIARNAELDQRIGIFRFMVQNAIISNNGWREDLLQFGARIGTVR